MTPFERRALLADRLEANAKNEKGMRFDLGVWVAAHFESPGWKPGQDCGTVGCAVGLAMLQPEFQAEGLLSENGIPSFDGRVSWGAVQEFFGVSQDTVNKLFNRFCYRPNQRRGAEAELEVARRLREYNNNDTITRT